MRLKALGWLATTGFQLNQRQTDKPGSLMPGPFLNIRAVVELRCAFALKSPGPCHAFNAPIDFAHIHHAHQHGPAARTNTALMVKGWSRQQQLRSPFQPLGHWLKQGTKAKAGTKLSKANERTFKRSSPVPQQQAAKPCEVSDQHV